MPTRQKQRATAAVLPNRWKEHMTGYTQEEAYLHALARKSFLKFWSWPNLFRNQGTGTNGGDGKEICDLVVVFGDDVLLFSDKRIEFNDKKELGVAWARWSRSAIKESVDQVRGARRWLQSFPDRIFLDKKCTKKLPLDLPPADQMRFHSIVVCHGVEEYLNKYNGEPSFKFDNTIKDNDHWNSQACIPFTIGKISNCGFVHIFNEATVGLILKEFDTIKDFISYLKQRENLISLSKHVNINSESDIVQLYYENLDEESNRSILIAKELRANPVFINKGGIDKLYSNIQFMAKKSVDKVSYFWDELVESFTFHILNGTSEFANYQTPNQIEPSLRIAAATSRFERRTLSESFIDFYNKLLPGQRGTRVSFDSHDSTKAYLFFLLPYIAKNGDYAEYREVRRGMLQDYCFITKLYKPHLNKIIGIAAQTRKSNNTLSQQFFTEGQDFVYFDASEWKDPDYGYAKSIKDEYVQNGYLAERKLYYENFHELPQIVSGEVIHRTKVNLKGVDRNKPCVCGSGKKFKKCCGK
jgi:hypothetical protein